MVIKGEGKDITQIMSGSQNNGSFIIVNESIFFFCFDVFCLSYDSFFSFLFHLFFYVLFIVDFVVSE
jgi:hypothetical protein